MMTLPIHQAEYERLRRAAWGVLFLFNDGELAGALAEDSEADTFAIVSAFTELAAALDGIKGGHANG